MAKVLFRLKQHALQTCFHRFHRAAKEEKKQTETKAARYKIVEHIFDLLNKSVFVGGQPGSIFILEYLKKSQHTKLVWRLMLQELANKNEWSAVRLFLMGPPGAGAGERELHFLCIHICIFCQSGFGNKNQKEHIMLGAFLLLERLSTETKVCQIG